MRGGIGRRCCCDCIVWQPEGSGDWDALNDWVASGDSLTGNAGDTLIATVSIPEQSSYRIRGCVRMREPNGRNDLIEGTIRIQLGSQYLDIDIGPAPFLQSADSDHDQYPSSPNMIVPDPSTFGYYGGSLTLQGSTASDAISSQPAIIAGNYLCFELCFLSTGAASYVHPSDRSLTAGNSLPTGTGGNITFRIEASITEYGAASGSEMLLDWIEIQEHSSTNADCQDCDTVDGNTNWCFCNCGPCSVVCRPPTLVVDSSDIDAGNWTNYPGPPCSGTSIPDFAPINSGVTYTGTFPSAADRHWWMCNLTQATIADDPPTWAAYIYETNLATADPNGTVALAYQLLYGPEVADNDPRAQGKLTVIALHARPSDESGGHPNFWQFGGWGPVSLSNYGSEVPGDCRHSNLFPSQSYSLEPGGGSAQDWIPGGPPRDCANPPQSWPSGWIRVNLGVVQVNCSCNSPPQIKFCANSAPPDVVAEAAPLSGGIPW